MKQKESRGNVKISIVALVRRTESLDSIPLVEGSGVFNPYLVSKDLLYLIILIVAVRVVFQVDK